MRRVVELHCIITSSVQEDHLKEEDTHANSPLTSPQLFLAPLAVLVRAHEFGSCSFYDTFIVIQDIYVRNNLPGADQVSILKLNSIQY